VTIPAVDVNGPPNIDCRFERSTPQERVTCGLDDEADHVVTGACDLGAPEETYLRRRRRAGDGDEHTSDRIVEGGACDLREGWIALEHPAERAPGELGVSELVSGDLPVAFGEGRIRGALGDSEELADAGGLCDAALLHERAHQIR
jgi:hypothetical protein